MYYVLVPTVRGNDGVIHQAPTKTLIIFDLQEHNIL